MFNKKPDFDGEDKETEKTSRVPPMFIEKAKEIFIEVPKHDVGSIIESIKENPENSLTVNDCDSSLWSDIYVQLNILKLHKFAKWDGESFKYR